MSHGLWRRPDQVEDLSGRCAALLRVLPPTAVIAGLTRPESHLRYLLVSAGLPEPEVNVAVHVEGEWIGIPDLHYPRARLALEYQGVERAGAARMRKDVTRVLDFDHFGWKVLNFGPHEVFRRQDHVVARVRAALVERDPDYLRRTRTA